MSSRIEISRFLRIPVYRHIMHDNEAQLLPVCGRTHSESTCAPTNPLERSTPFLPASGTSHRLVCNRTNKRQSRGQTDRDKAIAWYVITPIPMSAPRAHGTPIVTTPWWFKTMWHREGVCFPFIRIMRSLLGVCGHVYAYVCLCELLNNATKQRIGSRPENPTAH
jgi:hypothetical protein